MVPMTEPPSTPSPLLVDLPTPILTPRLLIRPKQPGDGLETSRAVHETWHSLHGWMEWAETLEDHTPEKQEIRTRQMIASYTLRETIELLAIERATGQPVVWCGFHNLQWKSRQCETGYWVRKSAQNRGFATEATNALLRYAFTALGMQRLGIHCAAGNEPSRRVIEKLGFTPEGTLRSAACLPGGRRADMLLYARLNLDNLPPLDVHWGAPPHADPASEATLSDHLQNLERRLLDPAIRKNQKALSALLTDDFCEFGSSGRTFSRPTILAWLAEENPAELTLTDFSCQRLGEDTALVTYRSHRHAPDGTTTAALRSSLWVRRKGSWQLHFHQGTRA